MDARTRKTSMDPAPAVNGEPAFFGLGAAQQDHPHRPTACPACGSLDLLSEPARDEDGLLTGLLLVSCGACAREICELRPPEPALEAELEPTDGSTAQ